MPKTRIRASSLLPPFCCRPTLLLLLLPGILNPDPSLCDLARITGGEEVGDSTPGVGWRGTFTFYEPPEEPRSANLRRPPRSGTAPARLPRKPPPPPPPPQCQSSREKEEEEEDAEDRQEFSPRFGAGGGRRRRIRSGMGGRKTRNRTEFVPIGIGSGKFDQYFIFYDLATGKKLKIVFWSVGDEKNTTIACVITPFLNSKAQYCFANALHIT